MRTCRRAAIACAIAGLTVVSPARAGQPVSPPHVRCAGAQTRDLLREGSRRSATFRRLVEGIEQSDVIVYVETASDLGLPVGAHLRMAGATPTARYLRILLKIPAGTDNAIALFGHELQHATEIARAAEVRDQRSLEALYRAIGEQMDAGWETRAARQIADVIRDELRHHDARPVEAVAAPAAAPPKQ